MRPVGITEQGGETAGAREGAPRQLGTQMGTGVTRPWRETEKSQDGVSEDGTWGRGSG